MATSNLGVDSGQMAWMVMDREDAFLGDQASNIHSLAASYAVEPGNYEAYFVERDFGDWGPRVVRAGLRRTGCLKQDTETLVGSFQIATPSTLVVADPMYLYDDVKIQEPFVRPYFQYWGSGQDGFRTYLSQQSIVSVDDQSGPFKVYDNLDALDAHLERFLDITPDVIVRSKLRRESSVYDFLCDAHDALHTIVTTEGSTFTGFVTSTGFGDGVYPLMATTNEWSIEFVDEDEEYE